jgi:hypothetical protein
MSDKKWWLLAGASLVLAIIAIGALLFSASNAEGGPSPGGGPQAVARGFSLL